MPQDAALIAIASTIRLTDLDELDNVLSYLSITDDYGPLGHCGEGAFWRLATRLATRLA